MTWGETVDTAAVQSGLEYAKNRLVFYFRDRPTEELIEAQAAYMAIFVTQGIDNALGMAEYLGYMINQREKGATA